MYPRDMLIDWRQQEMTQELLKEIAELSTDDAQHILNRRKPDGLDDQWHRGRLNALSDISAWIMQEAAPVEGEENDMTQEDTNEA